MSHPGEPGRVPRLVAHARPPDAEKISSGAKDGDATQLKEEATVIRLTRLNGSEMFLNADLVATVEARPDTVITLVDGKCFIVSESPDDVVGLVTRYRAGVLATAEHLVPFDTLHADDDQPRGAAVVRLFALPTESE
jgi:flagellar protein FlbD